MSYSAIGAVCAFLSNFIVIAGSLAGIEYWNTTVLAFMVVTPFGYVLQSWFTFGVELSTRRFIYFTGSVALGAVLFLALIGLFHSAFSMQVWIASPLATLIIFYWNYVASCWTVSSTTKKGLYPVVASRFSTQCKLPPTTFGKCLNRD